MIGKDLIVDDVAEAAAERALPASGFWRLFWRRLRKDRLALAGAALVAAFIAMAIAAAHSAPFNPNTQFDNGISDDGAPLPPGVNGFLFGTDPQGRALLSRLIWGARVSLLVGITANGIAVIIGVALGAIAGYYGGMIGAAIMRFTAVLLAFPVLLLGVALVAILTPGNHVIIMVIGPLSWTSMARIIHGQVVSLRERDFVKAARAAFRSRQPHSPPPHRPSPDLADRRLRLARRGHGRALRSQPQLPRHRHPAARSELGQDDRRRLGRAGREWLCLSVAVALPRGSRLSHRPGLQSARRWAARCPGSRDK